MKHAKNITVLIKLTDVCIHENVDAIDVKGVINAVELGHCLSPWSYTIYQLLMAGF